MTLNSAPVAARATERRLQELLNELLRNTFDGNSHLSLLGDQVYPLCDLFFNQTEIAAPDANPQIHGVFLALRSSEIWWGGSPAAWNSVLAQPTGGVAYGASVDDRVEETVHGRLIRSIPGTGIRWLADAAALREQVLVEGTWYETREFPGADAIQWVRGSSDYQEQVRAAGTSDGWSTVRTVYPQSPDWDGARKQVTGAATVAFYVRVKSFGGGDNRADFLCREIADMLKELLQSADTITALAAKGIRHVETWAVPTPLQTTGFQVRLVTMKAQLKYFLPRL